MSSDHRARLRRLRILQRLAELAPDLVTARFLLFSLRADPELNPTLEQLRGAYRYLAGCGLVELAILPSAFDDAGTVAGRLSTAGRAWLAAPGDQGLEIHSPDYLPAARPDNRRGRVSSIDVLDPEGKAWLDRQLVERNFTGYTDITEQFAGKGYTLSRAAIGRYGKRYKEELQELRQTVEMAKGFVEVVGDDAGSLAQTLNSLAQQEAIAVMRDKRFKGEDIDLPKLFSSIAQLNKSDISVKKYAAEIRRKTREVAERTKQTLAKAGASRETAEAIKRDILGIA